MNEVGRWYTNPSIKTRIEYVEKNGIKRRERMVRVKQFEET